MLLAPGATFRVRLEGHEIGLIRVPEVSADVVVTWPPDSQAFAITYSDGGAEGAFHARIFRLDGRRIIEMPQSVKSALKDFQEQYYCQARGSNIYALGWTSDPARLFLAVQVYPTGDCGEIEGKMGGYLTDLDGNIFVHFDNITTLAISKACERSGRASLPSIR